MYKNTNCFHLAIPCGDLEVAKKFYSETLGCRLDNSAQEWADVDFWGNELTLHKNLWQKYCTVQTHCLENRNTIISL